MFTGGAVDEPHRRFERVTGMTTDELVTVPQFHYHITLVLSLVPVVDIYYFGKTASMYLNG